MVHSSTSFGKLKEVVVGRELNVTKRVADITFKCFYKEALGQAMYSRDFGQYEISYEILQARRRQLDGLAALLKSYGVKVWRPDEATQVKKLRTPTFETENSSASNVRDLTLIYQDKIVETPTFIRNRYFENMLLYNVFNTAYDNGRGGQWIRPPMTRLTEDSLDLEDWRAERNYTRDCRKYEMAIDGAQFLRIGRDVVVNVATCSQRNGFMWVKSLFPGSKFHEIKVTDNHIDGMLVCLKPGVLLADQKMKPHIGQLPEKMQKWKFLFPEDLTEDIDVSGMSDADIRLASSRGMDINVLSLDEHRVVVNKRALGVKDVLSRNGFDVIEAQLDYGELFAGGIHCSTLDLVREDECISYM